MLNVTLFVLSCCAVPLTVYFCREAHARYKLDLFWLEREKRRGTKQEA